jgi:hypothetical protein
LAQSSERKSTAASKVCGLETEKNMESMLCIARDRECWLQNGLANNYKDKGRRTHVKQLKTHFKSFRDPTRKVEVVRKRLKSGRHKM